MRINYDDAPSDGQSPASSAMRWPALLRLLTAALAAQGPASFAADEKASGPVRRPRARPQGQTHRENISSMHVSSAGSR